MLSPSYCSLAVIVFVLVSSPLYGQQPPSTCQNMPYEHHNQVDYTLRVSSVVGVAKDVQGFEVKGACVGIFTENGQKLLAAKETSVDGRFEIEGLPNGRYRLVVTTRVLCAANAAIILKNKSRRGKSLVAVMKPSGIDACSWIELK